MILPSWEYFFFWIKSIYNSFETSKFYDIFIKLQSNKKNPPDSITIHNDSLMIQILTVLTIFFPISMSDGDLLLFLFIGWGDTEPEDPEEPDDDPEDERATLGWGGKII